MLWFIYKTRNYEAFYYAIFCNVFHEMGVSSQEELNFVFGKKSISTEKQYAVENSVPFYMRLSGT
jgi:hypothetical protein